MKCILPTCDLEGSSHFKDCCSFAHQKATFIVARNRGLAMLRVEAAHIDTHGLANSAFSVSPAGLMPRLKFDGVTFDWEKDGDRLTSQLAKVYRVMRDGRWRTLSEIREVLGRDSEAGISARLRDLRKPQFGGFAVERQRRSDAGLWEYRMVRP